MKEKVLSFVKTTYAPPLGDLTALQWESFNEFYQFDIPPDKREKKGLQALFEEFFPVEDIHKRYKLEFVWYDFGKPRYTPGEARAKSVTYGIPLKAYFRLIVRGEEGLPPDVIEQIVYIGEVPMLTPQGSFIINGVERVVISQLRRMPGVYFGETIHPTGKRLISAEIIPYRGPWIEIVSDVNDMLYIKLDRQHKIFITTLLRALGYEDNSTILRLFFDVKEVDIDKAEGEALADDIKKDAHTYLARAADILDGDLIRSLKEFGITKVRVLVGENIYYLLNTVHRDREGTQKQAVEKIYFILRGVPAPDAETARRFLMDAYFSEKYFYLGPLGRKRLNERLGLNLTTRTLTPQDIIGTVRYLLRTPHEYRKIDDADHLGNRQVRRIGDLLVEQYRLGFARLVWGVQEKMAMHDVAHLTPQGLLNVRTLIKTIMAFYTTFPLCQFMDGTNPLSIVTHKRRLSKLGPGGLTRETAGIEARDVHYSHYGRICPIETPEGQNVGVINTLALYARITENGVITTPYWRVEKGVVTGELVYLSATEEEEKLIAQALTPIDEHRKLIGPRILARRGSEYLWAHPEDIEYMEVSPKQMVGLSASLIPFLEHDDATRALMGSNMQRQAVPLLYLEDPIIATGMEEKVVRDSGVAVIVESDGVVVRVDSNVIVIKPDGKKELEYYWLDKFDRSNQNTCYNQRPIVKPGDKVKKGDIIADGGATKNGKLALGRDVLVAFMSWRGYNFEDAIVISERLLKDDVFTSFHIEELELEVRETRLGPEEVTRDVPNVPEEPLRHLDEAGLVHVGAYVKPGDILVGKITPRGEAELSPEERLLRAVFGQKAADVKDASLYVPAGLEGVVIDVQILSRRPKPGETDLVWEKRVERLKSEIKRKYRQMREDARKYLDLSEDEYKTYVKELRTREKEELRKAMEGDELPYGILKIIKVWIGQRRNLTIGDKLSGRHGNKGTIGIILPEHDMPFLEDGTPVDVVLDPLGVPSRMNIGQILETHLGWAAKKLNIKVVTPVFEGPKIEEISKLMRKAGLPENGKVTLRDGYTGEPFQQPVTVGYMYMMKLVHMAEDKIHARNIGPYSLITQQPLGGKSRAGGQRFGEMEVWALEAYGAAYALQEMLTVKSDDMIGRRKVYEAIIKGEELPEPGLPASFNVLLRELNGLCLATYLIRRKESDKRKEIG